MDEPEFFIVVDAGGGTVDCAVYTILTVPIARTLLVTREGKDKTTMDNIVVGVDYGTTYTGVSWLYSSFKTGDESYRTRRTTWINKLERPSEHDLSRHCLARKTLSESDLFGDELFALNSRFNIRVALVAGVGFITDSYEIFVWRIGLIVGLVLPWVILDLAFYLSTTWILGIENPFWTLDGNLADPSKSGPNSLQRYLVFDMVGACLFTASVAYLELYLLDMSIEWSLKYGLPLSRWRRRFGGAFLYWMNVLVLGLMTSALISKWWISTNSVAISQRSPVIQDYGFHTPLNRDFFRKALEAQPLPGGFDFEEDFRIYLKPKPLTAIIDFHPKSDFVHFVDESDDFPRTGLFNQYKNPHSEETLLRRYENLAGFIIGQLVSQFLADRYGRRKLYGLELIVVIFGTLGIVQCSAGYNNSSMNILGWIIFWRWFIGCGIAAEFPLSTVLRAEFAPRRARASMITAVFLMQPLGQFIASVGAAIIADRIWRYIIGVGALPALTAIIFRLTISESPRYTMDVDQDEAHALRDTTSVSIQEVAGSNSVTEIETSSQFKTFSLDREIPFKNYERQCTSYRESESHSRSTQPFHAAEFLRMLGPMWKNGHSLNGGVSPLTLK